MGVTSAERETIAAIPAPEPGLTAETLVARAAALQPLLREQQEANDRRGHYSDEVHQAFDAAGFYRILQPRQLGGYQLGPDVFLKVVMEISRGHPASAWCFTLAASHAYLIASHWPAEAQAELFGTTGDFRAAHVVGPAGTMARTEGGYVVDGVWPFCSGIPVSTHFIGGSLAPQPEGPPRHVFFVVPVRDVEILPDWGEDRFMGMQASGSNSVRIQGQFVPDHLIVDATMMADTSAYPGGSEGLKLYSDPIYQAVLLGWFHCEFGAIMTGAARAAIDAFAELARTKPMLTDPSLKRMEDPFIQNLYATALGKADSAEALTMAAIGLHMEQQRRSAREGTPVTALEGGKVWGMAREACRMANEAVEMLFHAAGASAGRRGDRLQRYFRDIEMYRLHIQSQPIIPNMIGRIAFGLPTMVFGSKV
jgi:3-hydroxy-9,10-secoandrosta-1,3,5(10)-triene-9,17-dione monooxygenase